MNKKEKESIALMLIKIAKDVEKYLLSEESQTHPAYHSESFLVSSFDEERGEILEKLLDDPVYTAKFSEEYLASKVCSAEICSSEISVDKIS